jgi:hypothetical protein
MYRPAMCSVPTAADLLVVNFAAFMQTRTAVLVEKSSPPVQGQTQFDHHMAIVFAGLPSIPAVG